MGLVPALTEFAHDPLVAGVFAALVVDFVLGVLAAVRTGTFAFSYVSDFARNDVLGKVLPWFVVYAMDFFTHGASLFGVAGIDLTWGVVAAAMYGTIQIALLGSIASSLTQLFPGITLPYSVGGSELATRAITMKQPGVVVTTTTPTTTTR